MCSVKTKSILCEMSLEDKSYGGSLLKRRKFGMLVNYWSHVDCMLNFSTKVFEYRIHNSDRDFRLIDLQQHRERINGSSLDPDDKLIEILEGEIVIRNARDTSGHFKSAIHLKPTQNDSEFQNWKAAFQKIVRIPEMIEKCILNALPSFDSSAEEKNLLADILCSKLGRASHGCLDHVWGLIQLRTLQLKINDFLQKSFEKLYCTISFGNQSFCDNQSANSRSHSHTFSIFKRIFISSQDSSEILICLLCRSTNTRSVLQLFGKLYIWDLVRQLSTTSASSSPARTSSILLYSPGSNMIHGTASLSYAVEYMGDDISHQNAGDVNSDPFPRESIALKTEFLINDMSSVAKQATDVMGPLMFERMVSADEIASLFLTLRVMKYPIFSFSPPLDFGVQKDFLCRAFFVDRSVATSMADSDVLYCTHPIIEKEAFFTLSTCCYHRSHMLDAFGGSAKRLLSWQYQVYSQSWLANFARMAQHCHNVCNVKLQAVEQMDAASFVTRDTDDRVLFSSRFPSQAIGEDGIFEVSVMHDSNENPERTLKILGQNVASSALHRFQDNLINVQCLRGNLIFLLRDKVRPFKIRSWGTLRVNSLLDQKPCTQWVHLQKYEDVLAPSRKEKIFCDGYTVLVTVSLCFDRKSINLPFAAAEPSEYISPPKAFEEWLSAHSQSHITGSYERSHYLQYMFQILCRRMVAFVAQLIIHGDCSVSWSSIPWNPDLPFPTEVRGVLTCFAHTYGIAPIYYHLQFAQELSDSFILSNYHHHAFIYQAVQCLSDALLLASGLSDSDFAWFQTLTVTLFQSASRSFYNVLCTKQIKQLDLMVIIERYVAVFSQMNAIKMGIHLITSAMLKGIPADTTSIGATSQMGDFHKEHLLNMILQDFVCFGDTICLQKFSQTDEGLLPFPGVYIRQQFLDVLQIFSNFLVQWKGISQDPGSSDLVGCAATGHYRRIICNTVDMCITSTLRGHDVLELWHYMQTIHATLASDFTLIMPHEKTADFTKLLAPMWLQTLPETASTLAFAVCNACRLDNLEVCDERHCISSSVIDGLHSSGVVVHEMQSISSKCLTAASDQLRLRMMMGLVKIPLRAAHELQTWIRKTFLEILSQAHLALRYSQAPALSKLINRLCMLCNNLAFLKDNMLADTSGWSRYYEDLIAGSGSRMQMPGLVSDSGNFVASADDAAFGPGPVQIRVTTGSFLGSGTSSDIFIVLHGIEGGEPSCRQQLKSGPKSFGTGRVDSFTIELAESLHQISKIEVIGLLEFVWALNSHSVQLFLEGSDTWTVDSVDVICPKTKKSAQFQCICSDPFTPFPYSRKMILFLYHTYSCFFLQTLVLQTTTKVSSTKSFKTSPKVGQAARWNRRLQEHCEIYHNFKGISFPKLQKC